MHTYPNYFRDVDFDSIFKSHPPPNEYLNGMRTWDRSAIESHQEHLFADLMDIAWQNPFYLEHWGAEGLTPQDVRSLDDITKLPIVTVYDLKDSIDSAPPFGLHQAGAVGAIGHEAVKLQSSGGTTGRPRPTLFGAREWEVQAIQTARALAVQGCRPGDILQIPVTLSTANMGWCYFQAAYYYLGVVPVTTGSGVVTSSQRQLEYAREWGSNLFVAFPEYLLHLANVGREIGLDPATFGMRFLSTYLGPDLSGALRRQLEVAWGCPVYDNYGTHEIGVVSFECREKSGLHFNEDTIFVEVVDPDTGKALPDGEAGDLVVTSLHRRYPPLVRYNLKDRVRLLPLETCACGSNARKMDHFLGRSDDMVKIRGVNIYPMACLDAVNSDPRTTGEWLCVAQTAGSPSSPRDELTIRVETHSDIRSTSEFEETMAERLKQTLGLRVKVEAVPAGSLATQTNYGGEGKVRRLVDERSAAQGA